MARGELQADHRAVGVADEGLQALDAQRVEQGGDGIGLVGRIQGDVEAAVGAEPVERDQPVARRVQRQACADLAFPPPALAEFAARRQVPVRRDAAGHEQRRQRGVALGFVAQGQRAAAGMAQFQFDPDLAAGGGGAHRGTLEGDRRGGGGTGDETVGAIERGGGVGGEAHGGHPK